MFPSFYREIARVSGLKPDWGSCRFGRLLRSRTWEHIPPHAPGSRWARVPLLLLDETAEKVRCLGGLFRPA
jgi:hypothetical protein